MRKYHKIIVFILSAILISAQGVFAKGPGNGEDTTSYGNNLSYPVVFAEGFGLSGLEITTEGTNTGLRTDGLDPKEFFIDIENVEDTKVLDDVTYYLQNSESHWEAEWLNGEYLANIPVIIDWSDNLFSTSWSENAIVRVEHVLSTNLTTPMNGYMMTSFTQRIDKQKTLEIQGTNSYSVAQITEARVFSSYAVLIIEKLDDLGNVIHTHYEGEAGAEINASGQVIYGYNWKIDDGAGQYRITFIIPSDTSNIRIIGHMPQTSGPTINDDLASGRTSIIITIDSKTSHKPANPGNGD